MRRQETRKTGEIMEQSSIKCDDEWPVCLLDFTFQETAPEFLVFKTKSMNIIENYFTQ